MSITSPTTPIHFCDNCNNLLICGIKDKKLIWKCPQSVCNFFKYATSSLVFVNIVQKNVTSVNLDLFPSAMKDDPTLHTTKGCSHYPTYCNNCGHNFARFTQAPVRDSATSIELVMFCCKCEWKWLLNE
jgi:DNA-directed RNA polymerase subunit M/transcription elongation factor TFIIS